MKNNINFISEKIYMFFVELLFKIIKKDLTDKKRQTFKEFLQFGLVGVSNTVISYLLSATLKLTNAPVDLPIQFL